METIHGFRSIKKPVIPQRFTALPATIAVTDIFFTKMENQVN